MFKWFRRDPVQTLRKSYEKKLEQALAAQRGGDMPRFAELTAEADQIAAEIEYLERSLAGAA